MASPVIYEIVCFPAKVRYVGQAKDPAKRWAQHKTRLANGRHENAGLRAAYRDYGIGHFEFRILEEVVDPKSLRLREQYWIRTFRAQDGLRLINHRRAISFLDPNGKRQYCERPKAFFWVEDPSGRGRLIINLRAFCAEHFLSYLTMWAVARRRGKNKGPHQGWMIWSAEPAYWSWENQSWEGYTEKIVVQGWVLNPLNGWGEHHLIWVQETEDIWFKVENRAKNLGHLFSAGWSDIYMTDKHRVSVWEYRPGRVSFEWLPSGSQSFFSM
ncbi:GIY-YIG nuclease family protein [Belnapia sp. T18]|uniref:GIY-YIG nuclease family protein n=1 Tax=Belnapia arida TaxID=2804533 RepID=A0ABS1UC99_9PROT|nr:GIY-YIG nuclease family protein [Belnapia arida]MBL6082283.1 GIY-YIG nuclease family protein [Belnapia arida]